MRLFPLLAILIVASSCFPTKIAPSIETYKITEGSKFHKSLLDHYCFIFNDPKNAYEFYNFINIIYELNHVNVDRDVEFVTSNELFRLSFFEVERITNFVNLVPIVVDAKLEEEGYGPFLQSAYESRKGNWYIILTVFDDLGNDALHPKHKNRKAVIRYLNELRLDYLKHHNYYEVLLNKNPDF